MSRRIIKPLLLLCGLGLGLVIGCKGGGGGGGNVGDAYINKLKSCGLLTEGELPTVDQSEIDDETSCILSCLVQLPCEELVDFTCDIFGEPSEELLACYGNCVDDEEGDFLCGSGETVPGFFQCDGEPDCNDGSDEQDCMLLECADGSGTYPDSFRCDGFPDCEDSSDELNCPGYYQCPDGSRSIPQYFVCDGDPDCDNGADEQGCPTYTCADGEVITGNPRCDLFEDCEDGSDELGCAQLVCPEP